MEDLVALEGILEGRTDRVFFITYGRIQDPYDASHLEELIFGIRHRFRTQSEIVAVRVCPTLQSAAQAPLFFEALFAFAQKQIPYGVGYDEWRRLIAREMSGGKHIYFTGDPLDFSGDD